MIRHVKNCVSMIKFAETKGEPLPVLVFKHESLMRRRLGDVDMRLQENKVINLSLATSKINGVIIKPGEVFSFWKLVGSCTKRKGYLEGGTISGGRVSSDIGGGMCQFSNLIHWMVLHSPLTIVEHHHHEGIDMFPDYERKVPFGCGTSIMYNYLDYRFQNKSAFDFQLVVYTNKTHLCGELRASESLSESYHVQEEEAEFVKIDDVFYRKNTILRQVIDKRTGNEIFREIIKKSHAKVMYDESFIPEDKKVAYQ